MMNLGEGQTKSWNPRRQRSERSCGAASEAIEKRDWKEAQRQAGILGDALARNTAAVRETLALVPALK